MKIFVIWHRIGTGPAWKKPENFINRSKGFRCLIIEYLKKPDFSILWGFNLSGSRIETK